MAKSPDWRLASEQTCQPSRTEEGAAEKRDGILPRDRDTVAGGIVLGSWVDLEPWGKWATTAWVHGLGVQLREEWLFVPCARTRRLEAGLRLIFRAPALCRTPWRPDRAVSEWHICPPLASRDLK